MKNAVLGVLGIGILLSCATGPGGPVDRGTYNPDGRDEGELAVLTIDRFVQVYRLDAENVAWVSPHPRAAQLVRIPPGVHTLYLGYNTGHACTMKPTPLMGNFEPGRCYKLEGALMRRCVSYRIMELPDRAPRGLSAGEERPSPP